MHGGVVQTDGGRARIEEGGEGMVDVHSIIIACASPVAHDLADREPFASRAVPARCLRDIGSRARRPSPEARARLSACA